MSKKSKALIIISSPADFFMRKLLVQPMAKRRMPGEPLAPKETIYLKLGCVAGSKWIEEVYFKQLKGTLYYNKTTTQVQAVSIEKGHGRYYMTRWKIIHEAVS